MMEEKNGQGIGQFIAFPIMLVLITLFIVCAIKISVSIGTRKLLDEIETENGFNNQYTVWVSAPACSDCEKEITANNLFRHLKKGHDIYLITTENQTVSSDSDAFQTVIYENDIFGYNCWDCDEVVTKENYWEHLEEGHRIMIKINRPKKTFEIGSLKYDTVDGDISKGIVNTSNVPLFVRIKVEDAGSASFNECLWHMDGDYIYFTQQLLPGESTGVITNNTVKINEVAIAKASLYAPDQFMKAFREYDL